MTNANFFALSPSLLSAEVPARPIQKLHLNQPKPALAIPLTAKGQPRTGHKKTRLLPMTSTG
jgi:hypothetical protein